MIKVKAELNAKIDRLEMFGAMPTDELQRRLKVSVAKLIENPWVKVRFAADCPPCECCGEEPWCPEHEEHLADCPCVGPTQDGYEYRDLPLGGLEARRSP